MELMSGKIIVILRCETLYSSGRYANIYYLEKTAKQQE